MAKLPGELVPQPGEPTDKTWRELLDVDGQPEAQRTAEELHAAVEELEQKIVPDVIIY